MTDDLPRNERFDLRRAVSSALRMPLAMPFLISAVLSLAVIGEVTYRNAHTTLTAGIALTDARIGAAKLLQLLTDAETAQRGYLLTSNTEYLEPLRNAEREFAQGSVFLKFIGAVGQTGPADAEKIRATVAAKFAEIDRTIEIAVSGDRDQALALVKSDNGKQLMDQLRELFNTKLSEAAQLQQHARDSIYTSLLFNRLAVLVLSCVLALGLYVHVRQARTLERERTGYAHALEREVAEKSAELRTLAAWLETAREEEKSHLACELHDELGGILTAAKLTMARLRGKLGTEPKLIELVDFVNLRLNDGISLKRRIIEDLRPSTLSTLGLHFALDNLCSDASRHLAVPVISNIVEVKIGHSAELAIFRVAQEALTNVGKYAKATEVTVRLEQDEAEVRLTITDNGMGFDPFAPRVGRHGLDGMRFRMESHGGTLSIVTGAQRGVTILAKLPKPKQAQNLAT